MAKGEINNQEPKFSRNPIKKAAENKKTNNASTKEAKAQHDYYKKHRKQIIEELNKYDKKLEGENLKEFEAAQKKLQLKFANDQSSLDKALEEEKQRIKKANIDKLNKFKMGLDKQGFDKDFINASSLLIKENSLRENLFIKSKNAKDKNIDKELKKSLADEIKKEKRLDKHKKDALDYRNARGFEHDEKAVEELALKKLAFEEELESKKKAVANKAIESNIGGLKRALSSVLNAGNQKLEKYFDMYTQHYSKINTSLIGTNNSYDKIWENLNKGLNGTPLVSIDKTLTSVADLLDKGIVYNLEERAFFNTVSEKIAATFDASNGTLTKLIRIHGRDLTKAYLGIEHSLTSFLNSNFLDTSYLAEGISKGVSEALIQATASMGHILGTQFEHATQTWLGSFTSMGASDTFVNKLAQGLGYLGSGDITSLISDNQLNSLFAVASNRAGLPYGQLMNGGLDVKNTNMLMEGLHNFVKEIVNSGDRITQNQYAQLFGLTLTDLISVASVQDSTIKSIMNSVKSYSELENITIQQLSKIGQRTHLKERIDNLFDNVFAGAAEKLLTKAGGAGYITYNILDFLESNGLGEVPLVYGVTAGLAAGFDLDTVNLPGLLKNAIMGIGLLGSMGSILGSGSAFNMDISRLNGSEVNKSRGQGLSLDSFLSVKGLSTVQSQSQFIGNSNEDSIQRGTTMDTNEATGGMTGKGEEYDEESDIEQKAIKEATIKNREHNLDILNLLKNNIPSLITAMESLSNSMSIAFGAGTAKGSSSGSDVNSKEGEESEGNGINLIGLTAEMLSEISDIKNKMYDIVTRSELPI